MTAVHPSWEAGADLPRVLDALPPAAATWADEDVPSAFEVPAGAGTGADGPPVPAVPGRVPTPSGRTLSAAAARRVRLATPFNTRRGRESRTALFTAWCREHGRVSTDPGTVPDYLAHLADRGHQPETLETYAGTLAHGLALSGHPLDAEDRSYISAIVNHRSAELAADPDGAGDALQATECTREDLAAMLATLDRSTVVGRRDACALTLDWYMAGRSCEPGALNIRDVVEETAEVADEHTGELLQLPALVVTVRRSKTNPHGRLKDVVRIVAQDDDTCPVAAWRAWREVLAAAGVERGPLLRRVKNGRLTTAGRPPRDPERAGGIGDRTIRNLVRDTAAAAGLTRALDDDERRLLSTAAEAAELAALAEGEREAFAAERRRARRLLRRSLRRYSGHSMRRGHVRHLQRIGTPRHVIEAQCRYVPGSKALARYLDDLVPWQDNPTVLMRRAAARPPGRRRRDGDHAGPGRAELRG
ncbi:site-specific integrase [Streptomyces coacervatus]|uniref:Site-specific integrase n=1 Tax=Streptomyces coacervatus TaxID=647381 RepID=A0ABP7HP67_9ACTN|nr:hypothetical protein [Streptomyces coacervatus]MDF2270695.1 hypothetical protein [Streptomyces coacervatus]